MEPPPPPLPNFNKSSYNSNNLVKDIVYQNINSLNGETNVILPNDDIELDLWESLKKRLGNNEIYAVSKIYHYPAPLIQIGPTCGLVAVSMACSLENKTISLNEILEFAKSIGVTKQGEIFSGDQMMRICKQYFGNRCNLIKPTEESILGELHRSHVILIPYDKDFNYEPCSREGKKSHWAILVGQLNILDSQPNHNEIIKDQLYKRKVNDNLMISERNYVYSRQGKSFKYHLWNLRNLLESNKQLCKLDDIILNDKDNFGIITNNLSRIVISIEITSNK